MPTIKEVIEVNLERIESPQLLRKLVMILSGTAIGDLSILSDAMTELKDRIEKLKKDIGDGSKPRGYDHEITAVIHILTSVSTIAVGLQAKKKKEEKEGANTK